RPPAASFIESCLITPFSSTFTSPGALLPFLFHISFIGRAAQPAHVSGFQVPTSRVMSHVSMLACGTNKGVVFKPPDAPHTLIYSIVDALKATYEASLCGSGYYYRC